ncbi:hypothetical protein NDU88_004360 [Pleurodeles waltl]|uniref:Uncharacterized protein n=1 Tax=Pleurodeles waltl TaxID=8319 RepID=A0AAV7MTP5_PLEWA|nr:hypothetical protein NDU88_004360 [Pleurodeles waltl]
MHLITGLVPELVQMMLQTIEHGCGACSGTGKHEETSEGHSPRALNEKPPWSFKSLNEKLMTSNPFGAERAFNSVRVHPSMVTVMKPLSLPWEQETGYEAL